MVETQASLAEVGEHLPDLRQFVDDDSVSEIIVNGPRRLFIERDGRLGQRDLEAAAAMITRGSGFDLRHEPIVDVRLSDGSRVAIAAPPASTALAITIRRFSKCLLSAADLVGMGSLPREVLQVVRDTLLGDGNVLIAGGTGSGKTTLLNACVGLLPRSDRIVVIEDTIEIRLTHPNALRLEGRALGRQDGNKGGVSIRDLVRHTLRHRPDHIVLGEVRGPEAADVIQALVTGHGGSLSTIHASTCAGALNRLATCALQAGDGLPWDVVCHSVAAAFRLVVRQARVDGRRAVREAVAVLGYEPRTGGWLTRTLWEEPASGGQPTAGAAGVEARWKRVAGVRGLLVGPSEPVTVADLLVSLGDTRRSPATRRLWRRRGSRRRPAAGGSSHEPGGERTRPSRRHGNGARRGGRGRPAQA